MSLFNNKTYFFTKTILNFKVLTVTDVHQANLHLLVFCLLRGVCGCVGVRGVGCLCRGGRCVGVGVCVFVFFCVCLNLCYSILRIFDGVMINGENLLL